MSMHAPLLCLQKTQHSDFAREELRNGRSLNLLANKAHLLNAFLAQSHDVQLAKKVVARWNSFMDFLRKNRLELVDFRISRFGEHYLLAYTTQSKVHQTQALKIDRVVRGDILYNFVPSVFVTWLDGLLDELPYDELNLVAAGG
jgi:hypothetical protein